MTDQLTRKQPADALGLTEREASWMTLDTLRAMYRAAIDDLGQQQWSEVQDECGICNETIRHRPDCPDA